MKSWTAPYFLVAASLLLVSVATHLASASATGDLVWSLQVNGNQAQLVVNRFPQLSHEFPMPMRTISIKHLRSSGSDEGRDWSLEAYVSPLDVTENGEIVARAKLPQAVSLSFVSARLVSVGGTFLLPKLPERMGGLAMPETFRARYEVSIPCLVDSNSFASWTLSPDKSLAVVNTDRSTRLINMATALATDVPEGPLRGVCFASRATVFAAVAIAGPKPRFGGPARSYSYFVTIKNWQTGQTLKSDPTDGVDKLAFVPFRDYVVYTRQNSGRPAEVVAMNTTTGTSTVLRGIIPEGDRYYSAANGSYMLVVQPGLTRGEENLGYGKASYYDITNLNSPKLLAEYNASDWIISGAVSDDGSLVALQVLEEGDATRLLSNVVVLDQDLKVVSEPVRRSPGRGVQFAGKYLFTGIEGNTVELYGRPATTNAFDFNR